MKTYPFKRQISQIAPSSVKNVFPLRDRLTRQNLSTLSNDVFYQKRTLYKIREKNDCRVKHNAIKIKEL